MVVIYMKNPLWKKVSPKECAKNPSGVIQGVDQGALWRSLDKVHLLGEQSWMFVDLPGTLMWGNCRVHVWVALFMIQPT